MPTNSGQFKPGNPHRVKPGQRIALKHGGYSVATLEKQFAELESRFESYLAQNPIPNHPVDTAQRERWLILAAQASAWLDYFRAHGGLFTRSGNARKGVDALIRVFNQLDKQERSLALGPLARAQAVQSMAAGRRDQAEIEARFARMRAKQDAAVAESARQRLLSAAGNHEPKTPDASIRP